MKTFYPVALFLCLFFSTIDSYAQVLVDYTRDLNVVAGHNETCLYSESEVFCLSGTKLKDRGSRKFDKIRKVVVTNSNTCVLDSKELYCEGYHDISSAITDLFPNLDVSKIKDFSVDTHRHASHGEVCILTDKLKCFFVNSINNSYGKMSVPELKNVKSFSMDQSRICIVASNGLECFIMRHSKLPWYKATSVREDLESPSQVIVQYGDYCALDGNKVKCGELHFNNAYDPKEDYPRQNFDQTLKNPKSILQGGRYHFCALDEDGVRCWGYLDFEDRETRHFPVLEIDPRKVPNSLKNPRQLAVGEVHNCVLDDEGLKCWGLFYKRIPRKSQNVRSIKTGSVTCTLDDLGTNCWGDPTYVGSRVRYQMAPPQNIKLDILEIGDFSTCGIQGDDLICWGKREKDSKFKFNKPVDLKFSTGYLCAQDSTGIRCFYGGTATYSGKANKLREDKNVPKFENPRSLTVAQSVGCAIDKGSIKCWGSTKGHGPDGGAPGYLIRETPTDLVDPIQVVLSGYKACAITAGGDIRCWGKNLNPIYNPPKLINPRLIAASQTGIFCANDDEGVKCWGNMRHMKDPIPLDFVKDPISISVGPHNHVCALGRDFKPKCAGSKHAESILFDDFFNDLGI